MDKFEGFSKKVVHTAKKMGKKTESMIETQKIKSKINTAQQSVLHNYKDIGEIIFNRYRAGEAVDDELAIICEEISQIRVDIDEYREKMAQKKDCSICDICGGEVPKDASYCMKCGAVMPEEEPEAETEPEPEVEPETPEMEVEPETPEMEVVVEESVTEE